MNILFAVLFALAGPVAEAEEPQRFGPFVSDSPCVEDYETSLKSAQENANRIFDPKTWAKTEMQNKRTGIMTKFSDLPAFEQDMFYIIQGEMVIRDMHSLNRVWDQELKRLKANPALPLEGEKADDPKRIAKVEDVEKAKKILHELRCKFAKDFDARVKKAFEKYADRLPEEERTSYLDSMKKWNEREKLN